MLESQKHNNSMAWSVGVIDQIMQLWQKCSQELYYGYLTCGKRSQVLLVPQYMPSWEVNPHLVAWQEPGVQMTAANEASVPTCIGHGLNRGNNAQKISVNSKAPTTGGSNKRHSKDITPSYHPYQSGIEVKPLFYIHSPLVFIIIAWKNVINTKQKTDGLDLSFTHHRGMGQKWWVKEDPSQGTEKTWEFKQFHLFVS